MLERARRAMIVAVVGAAAGACLFPSLDGVSGADAGDAAFDAPSDAPSDALAPTDGGAEARPFSCAEVDAKFCDDFDDSDSSTTFSRWSSEYVVNGGTATRAPSDASAPFAAQFTTPSTPGQAPYALFHRSFTGTLTSGAHLAFDLRIDKFPSSPQSFFSTGAITMSTANGGGIGLDLLAHGSLLQETVFLPDGGTDYPTQPLALDPPLGKWVHVDILLAIGNGLATVQVLFDGKTALAPTNLDARIPWGTPDLVMGETYVDPNNDGVSFLVDDVTFDFQ